MEEEPREQEILLQPERINITAGGAVDSVNGMTGDVILTTSDLENTAGFQTSSEVESAISAAVGAEQTAREQADSTISASVTTVANNLATEVTNRTNADTALQTSIGTLTQNLATETTNRTNADTQLQNNITAVQNSVTAEATARENADTSLQGQIDAISASSDVKDIVGTHAALENYDTSTLGNNDIIKVLQDETEGGATTYYRWNATTQTFSLIGEEGPYYTKSQTDTLLNAKQDDLTAGSNITISGSTISATNTTYTAGTGLDLTGTEFSVDNTVAMKTDIPTVNNATLKIQKNSTNVATFTANSSTDVTANITVPTKVSDLSNDSGFITNSVDNLTNYTPTSSLATVATSGSYSDLSNKPTIPAAQVNSDWNASSGVAEILNKPALATVATSGAYSDLSGTPTIVTTVSSASTDAQIPSAKCVYTLVGDVESILQTLNSGSGV